jgi:hypothetical protein
MIAFKWSKIARPLGGCTAGGGDCAHEATGKAQVRINPASHARQGLDDQVRFEDIM